MVLRVVRCAYWDLEFRVSWCVGVDDVDPPILKLVTPDELDRDGEVVFDARNGQNYGITGDSSGRRLGLTGCGGWEEIWHDSMARKVFYVFND